MTTIYILKLEKNKYYVGKTNNLEKRKEDHMNGTASLWTKKYKPLSVEKIIPNASPYDEDKYTIEYMNKYGIDNVRGGIYVTEDLDELQRYTIQKSIWGANDCCTKCGVKGHFIKDCNGSENIYEEYIYEDFIEIWQCDYCNKEYEDVFECEKHENYCKNKQTIINKQTITNNKCFQCGKSGHYANECPNKEKFNCRYCNKEFESQKGTIFHENIHCKSKCKNINVSTNTNVIYTKKVSSNKKNNCYRCGRSGHFSNECYAKTHI